MIESQQHFRFLISGNVQGVGFRPFVFQLAQKLRLQGSVCNSLQGVVIHLQGQIAQLKVFEAELHQFAPDRVSRKGHRYAGRIPVARFF